MKTFRLLNKRSKSDNISICVVLFSIIFTIFIVLPSNLLLVNQNEITISYPILVRVVLPKAILSFTILSLIFILLPNKVFYIVRDFLLSVGVGLYVQYMFMNYSLSELDGRIFDIKKHLFSSLLNLAIWGLIIAIPILLRKRNKSLSCKSILYTCAAVILIQTVGLIMGIIEAPKSVFQNKTHYYATDNEFEMASDSNIIVFIIDAVDNDYIDEIMINEPYFFDEFKDFTLYNNTCSVYDYTHTSLNQMLTGYCYGDQKNYSSEYYKRIKDAGYRLNFYGYTAYNGFPNIDKFIDNYEVVAIDDNEDGLIFYDRIFNDFIDMSLYQSLPYFLKPLVNVSELKYNHIKFNAKSSDAHYQNEEFANNLKLTVNNELSNEYTIYHIEGTHFPCENYVEKTKYCLNIGKDMIMQLKQLGIYDSSTVIIMSDHGLHDQADDYEWPTAGTPLFMIKEKNKEGDKITISNAPIYFKDYMSTILVNMNLWEAGDMEMFGQSIYDIAEDEPRERVWYDRFKDENDMYRSYKYVGNYDELKRMVEAGIYEDIDTSNMFYSQ